MAPTFGNLLVHLIFSTKQPKPLIRSEIRSYLVACSAALSANWVGRLFINNGTYEHVHMLIRARPAHSMAAIVRVVKADSSKWLREKGHKEFAWQSGYGVFSVSASNVAAVTKYIAMQDEHHKRRSFQEEFLAFLKRNDITYDERYIWD